MFASIFLLGMGCISLSYMEGPTWARILTITGFMIGGVHLAYAKMHKDIKEALEDK